MVLEVGIAELHGRTDAELAPLLRLVLVEIGVGRHRRDYGGREGSGDRYAPPRRRRRGVRRITAAGTVGGRLA